MPMRNNMFVKSPTICTTALALKHVKFNVRAKQKQLSNVLGATSVSHNLSIRCLLDWHFILQQLSSPGPNFFFFFFFFFLGGGGGYSGYNLLYLKTAGQPCCLSLYSNNIGNCSRNFINIIILMQNVTLHRQSMKCSAYYMWFWIKHDVFGYTAKTRTRQCCK